ncbi:4467_t:CDS:1, partial [Acaulospora morrowiae]
PISELITPSSQDLSISELFLKSCSPSIDHITSTEETSITENSNQINIPNKWVKNRKPRSRGIAYSMSQRDTPMGLQSNKSVQISDSSNSGASIKAHIINKSDIPNTLTKKAEKYFN